MVLCFFDRFYVTVGDLHVLEFDNPRGHMEHMHVSLYDAVLFPPVVESQETNPWRTLARADDVGGEQLFDRRVAFGFCSQMHNGITESDVFHRAGA